MRCPQCRKGFTVLTLGQIAERADVHQSAPHQWRKRYEDFPSPIHEDPLLFLWEDVAQWLERRRPYGRVTG